MRREKSTILGEVLGAIEDERVASGDVRLTSVASRANVAYDRLLAYLAELERAGLVVDAGEPHLSLEGRAALDHYRAWDAFRERLLTEAAAGQAPVGAPAP